jgi:hypothetical protein
MLTFSPDSKRVAYAAINSQRWMMVIDGKEGKSFDYINKGASLFSPDSKRVVYEARRGKKWTVVIDEKEGNLSDAVASSTFSPDSKRVAYMAMSSEGWHMVFDGQNGNKYDGILVGSTFSPKTLDGASYMFFGGRKENDPHERLNINAGEKISFDSPDTIYYLALKGKNLYLVKTGISKN